MNSAAPSELRRWRNAVFILFFVQGIASSSWLSRIPTLRDDTGMTVAGTGTFLLAGSIGAILGLSATTFLVARIGAHRSIVVVMTLGLAGVVWMGVGSTVLGSIIATAFGLFAFGFGFGANGVLVNIEGSQAERALGKTLLPLMHGFYSIGTVVGAIIATLLAALHVSVLAHFTGAVCVGAVLAAWAMSLLPDRPELQDDAPTLPPMAWHRRLRANLLVWRESLVVFMALCLLGTSFSEGAANDWIALGMVDGHGYPNAMGALAFGMFVGGMTLIRVLGGPLIDRFGRVVMFRASVLCIASGIVAFVVAPVLWISLVASLLWGLGIGLSFPTMMSAAGDAPNGTARVAAVASVGYASGLVGPPVLGWIGAHAGVLGAQLALLPLLAMAFVLGFAASGARRPS
ncbi:MAG: MFS transporter [Agromyces sp.]